MTKQTDEATGTPAIPGIDHWGPLGPCGPSQQKARASTQGERETLSPALREQIVAMDSGFQSEVERIALLAYAEGQQVELARCVDRAAAHYAFGLRDELAQRLEELQR